MPEYVARRLRRFQRKGSPGQPGAGAVSGERGQDGESSREIDLEELALRQEKPGAGKAEIDRDDAMQLALREVQRFKEEHNRLPQKQEYDQIAENVYSQLKEEAERKRIVDIANKRAGIETHRKREAPKREAGGAPVVDKKAVFGKLQQAARGMGAADFGGMSVKDLFGKDEKQDKSKPAAEDGREIGGPEGDENPGEGEEFGLGELSDLEAGSEKCPNCGRQGSQLIFCPECGGAFCESCSPGVEAIGNSKTFVCPKCGKKVKR